MMDALRETCRSLWMAIGYFTRIPVPASVGFSQDGLNRAARFFPLVGWLVGGAGALAYWLASRTVPAPGAAVAVSMVVTLLLTGAFHEDGLADCADGFGGGYTPEDRLRIMRDSRIGAFGAIAVCMALLLKWQLLTALAAQHAVAAMAAMVAAHAASRGVAVSYLLTHDYVRVEGKAKPVAQPMGWREAAWAAVFGGLPLLWFGVACAAVAAIVLLGARWALGRYFARRLGGITGDCLGLAQQAFELLALWVLLAWTSS
ncbi:adenosylcobinamide-GDP ribazoletransferase [Ralstonia solanacearum]|uniref:Adenosylcobinamide-GDP ribazoletransferase n=1 Tax=Ralstonia solanacearum K60 TaxID=1091042 RepID=A0AAP8D4Z6_RALSL|nr:adenosylcobinamide-GDP ribazoletransferase [Ralstonia solanacearum]MBT1538850.1 adenosylcobinamide-GDP ribazoletransferase [Ralstonia solanacearum]OYQ14286.1 adenosylcobinamide-GDP ribazoletransferase [Ralstonia solanacearum K60]QOK81644.1 adenosylcobinamide-GDP ribazoletransferase [Ralstonia solanacearum]RIJ85908.1 adenosylcobinamide-GDP ribazoletransferase [Ralstonia solanacearum]CCF98690.1 cobalamin 5'-phosphate synthase [Ralstonia solanacearum K60]